MVNIQAAVCIRTAISPSTTSTNILIGVTIIFRYVKRHCTLIGSSTSAIPSFIIVAYRPICHHTILKILSIWQRHSIQFRCRKLVMYPVSVFVITTFGGSIYVVGLPWCQIIKILIPCNTGYVFLISKLHIRFLCFGNHYASTEPIINIIPHHFRRSSGNQSVEIVRWHTRRICSEPCILPLAILRFGTFCSNVCIILGIRLKSVYSYCGIACQNYGFRCI